MASRKRARNQLFFRAVGKAGVAPCHWCGIPLRFREATVDHVKPRLVGGPDRIENYVIACLPCNTERSKDTSRQGNVIRLWRWGWSLRIQIARALRGG
jgi:5-methylcytosine-specific restriction endonuclease McrA